MNFATKDSKNAASVPAVCDAQLSASTFPNVVCLPDQDLWSPERGWLAEQCVDPTS